jgi:uncharacterized CHY-type Zn-finger protein
MMYVSTIYCTVCFLTFTESEYEATSACPYCNNDDAGKLLDVNGDFDLIVEGDE